MQLVLIGDGPLRDELEAATRELGISNDVQFRGNLARDQVFEALAELDIFAIASRFEGFGNSVLEAMAANKPVLVTEADALMEVAGPAGIIVPIGDPATFGRELASLADDKARLHHIGRACRERALNFDLESCAQAYENVYAKLV
jgi:2-deoxystreptamine N-acetyl-D-glucosaminyltransferase/2-deoxystreptamine glucosyltransferase